jgi:hypothetical protein
MKDYQNASRSGLITSIEQNIVSTSDESSEETYANGMVLSYLDSLMSGNND